MKNNKRENEMYAGKEVKVEEYYRKMIIKVVEKIENPATLKFILSVIESYLKCRGI